MVASVVRWLILLYVFRTSAEGCWFFEHECSNGECISALLPKCDGKADCADGSDEADCESTTATETSTTSTTAKTTSVSFLGTRTTRSIDVKEKPKLKAFPSHQVAHEDQEVVLQCRDEGDTRFKVHWLKEGGDLPENSAIKDGRLTIPKIKCEDSGVYICYVSRFKAVSVSTVDVDRCKHSTKIYYATQNTPVPANLLGTNIYNQRNFSSSGSDNRITTTALIPYGSGDSKINNTAINCLNLNGNGSCCKIVCEKNCSNTDFNLPAEYFKCANGEVIFKNLTCNKKNDCKDGSDEFNCYQNCSTEEFQCEDRTCIPRLKICDGDIDCPDSSDESRCGGQMSPKITKLPELEVEINCLDPLNQQTGINYLELECQFVGNPVPVVRWEKADGRVPPNCQQSTINGRGLLKCPDFQQGDQGAYYCVAENSAGIAESQPKSMIKCKGIECTEGFKVRDSLNIETCLECFCSGKAKSGQNARCHGIGSEMTTHELEFSDDKTEMYVNADGTVSIMQTHFASYERVKYCSVPKATLKKYSFIKSYGRNLRVSKNGEKAEFALNAPDVIAISNGGLILTHSFNDKTRNSSTKHIRFWKGFWSHNNKSIASRNDIMKTLSNLDMLLLRCEYKKGGPFIQSWGMTLESSLVSSHMSNSISYLEKCTCPIGYDGLSCEICTPGYVKTQTGDDFLCEKIKQCPVGYTGEICDRCDEKAGYYNHSKRGCIKANCNMNGSMGLFPIEDDKCLCKERVTGKNCDRCKEGSFFLDNKNPKGCKECWCNDVSDECSSSDWYISSIYSTSLGGYKSKGRDFWLLPDEFRGNRLSSYGGILRYTMKYQPNMAKQPNILTVEILSENDVTLKYENSNLDYQKDGVEKMWEVRLEEPYWRDRNRNIVSRGELLRVLSRVKAFYIESPYPLDTKAVNLSLVQLDVADEMNNDNLGNTFNDRASKVEKCICPDGYQGLSCESCATGFYKKRNGFSFICQKCECDSDNCDPEKGCQDCGKGKYRDNPNSFGPPNCVDCPCNKNEEFCFKDQYDQVVCECKMNYTGINCEINTNVPPITHLKVEISPNKVRNRKVGAMVRFNCSYDSTEEMNIVFERKYSEQANGLAHNNDILLGNDGIYTVTSYGTTRIVDVQIDLNLEFVECVVYNSRKVEVGRVAAVIEDTVTEWTIPRITNCYDEPKIVDEGEDIELICQADGSPSPSVQWYIPNEHIPLPIHTYEGVHTITKASLEQNGTIYTCIAMNLAGDAKCSTHLVVKKRCEVMTIRPNQLTVEEGEAVKFQCNTTSNLPVKWSRVYTFLPMPGYVRDGAFTIENATVDDAGEYLCSTISDAPDELLNKTVTLTVKEKRIPPNAVIVQKDTDLVVGDTFKIDCKVSGKPLPAVTWTEVSRGFLPRNVDTTMDGLSIIIRSATLNNTGFYQCNATSSGAVSTALIYIRVLEQPKIRIEPKTKEVVLGSTVTLNCIVEAGNPRPEITWKSLTSRLGVIANNNYIISNVDEETAGKYICMARNSAGFAEAVAEVKVLVKPTASITPAGSLAVYEGEYVEFVCEVDGIPEPTIEWRRTIMNDGFISYEEKLKENGKYINVRMTLNLHGITCVASNKAGQANDSVVIKVQHTTPQKEGISKKVRLGERVEMIFDGIGEKFKCHRQNASLIGDECYIPNGLAIESVQVQHNGTYICESEQEESFRKMMSYTILVTGFVQKFTQSRNSYLILPIVSKARDFTFEIALKAENNSGIIAMKKGRYSDFSMYLSQGHVAVKLHFGKNSTTTILQSKKKLKIEVWYTVLFTSFDYIATLTIYDDRGKIQEEVKHKLPQQWMPGSNELFVGGVTHIQKLRSKISRFGFGGCISRLIVDDYEYHITNEAKYSKNVKLCNTCTSSVDPCGASGVCFDAPTQFGFVCVCDKSEWACRESCLERGCLTRNDLCKLVNPCGEPQNKCVMHKASLQCTCAFGFSGATCERGREERFEFGLDGYGHLKLPSFYLPRLSLNDPEIITIKITPESLDGLLLWQGEDDNFFYIAIENGKLVYLYHNQGKKLQAETGYILKTGSTHEAVMTRRNNTVQIQVDNGDIYEGEADFTTNRVKGDIYIGGISDQNLPNYSNVPNIKYGYKGCIHRVSFGKEKPVDILADGVKTYKITKTCPKSFNSVTDSGEGRSKESYETDY